MADLIKRDSALKGYDTVLSILDSAVNAVSEAKAIVLQYGSEPAQQWIPCSEQEYPSNNREVEVTCEVRRIDGKTYRYTCHAVYVHKYSIESTGYCDWDGCDEYNEEDDTYYALPGWYERVHNYDEYSYWAIPDFVTAWRELPEPWKGEQDE